MSARAGRGKPDAAFPWRDGFSAVSFIAAGMVLGALERLVTPGLLGLPALAPHVAASIADAARDDQHLLITVAGDNTLRLVPPLIVSKEQVEQGIKKLRSVVAGSATA